MAWTDDLSVEVLGIFAEAQRYRDHCGRKQRQRVEHRLWLREHRAKERRRDRLRTMRRIRSIDYRAHLARKREEYANSRGTAKHEEMLARARRRSSERYAAMSRDERSERARRESARRQANRAAMIGEVRCEECGAGVDVAPKGPPPRFCSGRCQSRSYRRSKRRTDP